MARFGIVGCGRVGGALAAALVSRVGDSLTLSSRTIKSTEDLAFGLSAAFESNACVATPSEVVAASEVVFLCTPDSAIHEVASQLPWSPGQLAVHTSGAKGLEVLRAAAQAGAATGSFHPLSTFPAKVTDASTANGARAGLQGAWAAVSSDSCCGEQLLRGLATDHCRGSFSVPEPKRTLYHAMAVFSSNYIVALAAVASRIWAQLGIDETDGLRYCAPLLRNAMLTALALGPEQALTGPVSRGDLDTVEAHLAALADTDGAVSLVPLYANLAAVCGELARHRGSIDERTQIQLDHILGGRQQ